MKDTQWLLVVFIVSGFGPFAIAFLVGLANQRFMKFKNIDLYISSSSEVTYRARISLYEAIVAATAYIGSTMLSLLLVDFALAGNYYIAALITFGPFLFFWVASYIFCDMVICGNNIYIYDITTLFRVHTVDVRDITGYTYGGFSTIGYVTFNVKTRPYMFWCVGNELEFVDAIDKVKRGKL
jgi:hypothetical protein